MIVDKNVTDCIQSPVALSGSTVLAVVYVAAYSNKIMKEGLVPKDRLGCRKEQKMFVFNACASVSVYDSIEST
jgi:hypothetical protein